MGDAAQPVVATGSRVGQEFVAHCIAQGLGCERMYVISTFDVVALYLGAPYNLSEYTPGSESSRGGGLTFCPWSLSEVKLLVDEISEEVPMLI